MGYWTEMLNSDARDYGGSGQGNLGGVEASPIPLHGRPASLTITLPPLAIVIFKLEGRPVRHNWAGTYLFKDIWRFDQ